LRVVWSHRVLVLLRVIYYHGEPTREHKGRTMMHRIAAMAAAVLLITSGTLLGAQEQPPFSLTLIPGFAVPLGPRMAVSGGKPPYTLGFSADLVGEYRMPFSSILLARGLIGYCLLPVVDGSSIATSDLSLVSFGLGPAIGYSPVEKLTLNASAIGGYYLGAIGGQTGGNLFFSVDASVGYRVLPALSIMLGAGYKYYLTPPSSDTSLPGHLYDGLGAPIGATYTIGIANRRSRVEFISTQFDPIFPVLSSYYDSHPFGSLILKNREAGSISNVKVLVFVNEYMDGPRVCAEIGEMKRDEERTIPLEALFTDKLLEITEGKKVTVRLSVEYSLLGSERSKEADRSVQVHYRNAITWDDDRKAAAFVTAKDPQVLRFTKNVVSGMREQGPNAINGSFRQALCLLEALRLHGMSYVVDPASSYGELSKDKLALDFLQFPVETLAFKAGDCDDLTVLYAAMLEAVSIPAAFITTPGHIFLAFSLGMQPGEARSTFRRSSDLIFRGDTTWVPVEVTLVADGFLKAWQAGAKQWRESTAAGDVGFYPVQEAWKLYAPVGSPGRYADVALPSSSALVQAYLKRLDEVINDQIKDKVAQLEAEIKKAGADNGPANKLGVLYARFGLYDKATAQLQDLADKKRYFPSIMNLASIYYLQGDMKKALDYYGRAAKANPTNTSVLLGLAKANAEIGNTAAAKKAYDQMASLDPDMASQYAYLGSGGDDATRASSASIEEAAPWQE
jgi:tetratricopeptide (TPR) repeat protein